VRLEGLGQLKSPITSRGIEPADLVIAKCFLMYLILVRFDPKYLVFYAKFELHLTTFLNINTKICNIISHIRLTLNILLWKHNHYLAK
jgi:hypothetical protein